MSHAAPPHSPNGTPTAEFAPAPAHTAPAAAEFAPAPARVVAPHGAPAAAEFAPLPPAPASDLDFFAPRLGPDGEACASCGAALASDQRYCLNCGERRAAARVPFPVAAAPAVVAAAPVAPPRRSVPVPVWTGLAGVAAVSLGILAGIVLMNARDDDPAPTAAAVPTATATVAATVTPPPAVTPEPSATVEAAPATFTPDWPAGTNGWTVQLRTLPKDGTTPDAVNTAKSDATASGAADVGALDADEYPSLDGGVYVIYSTVSTSKADAQAVLDGLQANFPEAKVVEVSSEAPVTQSDEDLKEKEATQTPEEAQKELRNAPDKSTTEGDPLPEADDEAAGGGSETTEF